MSQQSMRKAGRLAASDTHPSRTQRSRFGIESRSDRGPRSSCCSKGRAERLLAAQRMSTGSGGDCEIPFFPDDSHIRATEQPISVSELDHLRSRS